MFPLFSCSVLGLCSVFFSSFTTNLASVLHVHVYIQTNMYMYMYMYMYFREPLLVEPSDKLLLSQSLPSTGGFCHGGLSPSPSLSSALLLPPRLSPDIMAPANLKRAGEITVHSPQTQSAAIYVHVHRECMYICTCT